MLLDLHMGWTYWLRIHIYEVYKQFRISSKLMKVHDPEVKCPRQHWRPETEDGVSKKGPGVSHGRCSGFHCL